MSHFSPEGHPPLPGPPSSTDASNGFVEPGSRQTVWHVPPRVAAAEADEAVGAVVGERARLAVRLAERIDAARAADLVLDETHLPAGARLDLERLAALAIRADVVERGVACRQSTSVMSHAPEMPSGSLFPHAWSSPLQHAGEHRPVVAGPPSTHGLPTHVSPGRHGLPAALFGQQPRPIGSCWLLSTGRHSVPFDALTTHSCCAGQSWRTMSQLPFRRRAVSDLPRVDGAVLLRDRRVLRGVGRARLGRGVGAGALGRARAARRHGDGGVGREERRDEQRAPPAKRKSQGGEATSRGLPAGHGRHSSKPSAYTRALRSCESHDTSSRRSLLSPCRRR